MPFSFTGTSREVERRVAVGVGLVARRRHRAVTVRVHDVAVDERLRRQVGAVQTARRDQHLAHLAVDQVPVDVDVADLVVGLQVLQRRVGVADHVRVPEARVVDRAAVGVDQRLRFGGRQARFERREVEVRGLDCVEPECVARGPDVAIDVLLLGLVLVRADLELLHRGRVDRADHQGDERPQPDRDDREHPPATPDVPEEESGGADRDEDQEVERGELRLHVGVARTLDDAAGGEVQLEPAEVVLRRLDQCHHREDHRQVGLDLRGHPLEGALEADPTVEVVLDRGDDQHDHEPGEQPLGDELEERELEDVEADVLVELGIDLVEALVVGEEDPLLPLR